MVSVQYLETVVAKLIKDFCSEVDYNEFACALSYYKTHQYDEYRNDNPAYDRHPDEYLEDTFNDVMENLILVVERDTVLVIGDDDDEELRSLGEVIGDELRYDFSSIYPDDMYDDDFLSVDENGIIGIAPNNDNGELSDAISDDTGYLVSTVAYKVVLAMQSKGLHKSDYDDGVAEAVLRDFDAWFKTKLGGFDDKTNDILVVRCKTEDGFLVDKDFDLNPNDAFPCNAIEEYLKERKGKRG